MGDCYELFLFVLLYWSDSGKSKMAFLLEYSGLQSVFRLLCSSRPCYNCQNHQSSAIHSLKLLGRRWTRRGACGDTVPHDRLARTRQTSLHWLSTGAAGHDHQFTDELWKQTHHCHLQVRLCFTRCVSICLLSLYKICSLSHFLSLKLSISSISHSIYLPNCSISHYIHLPNCLTVFLSPPSPVMEWVEQGPSSVSTLSWSDSRQRVWSMCSRPSSQLVSRELASSEMQYVYFSITFLFTLCFFLHPSLIQS